MKYQPALVIMAAGIGSRFGGLKQLAPVGKNGEPIIKFSLYDAMEAGFKKVVFIIKKEIDADFRTLIGDPVSRHMEIEYVYQELDKLPPGFAIPEGRVKPWEGPCGPLRKGCAGRTFRRYQRRRLLRQGCFPSHLQPFTYATG